MPTLLLAALLASSPLRVAVLEIQTKTGFDKEVRDIFVDFLQSALRDRGFKVIGKSDIEAMIGLDRMQSALGCQSNVCFAEIGGALGADELVVGSLAKLDNSLSSSSRSTSSGQRTARL